MTNKEKAQYLIFEMRQRKFLEDLFKKNTIEFDNYFKYSGEIEEKKALITQWVYERNHKCSALHEKFIKVKQLRNENNIKNEK